MARFNEDSVANQIRQLAVGQSFSRSRRLSLITPEPVDAGKALNKLRNSINQVVGRLRREDPGSYFRVESVTATTSDHRAVICTAVVTKLDEDEAEETDI